jgi:hypothetical protein
MRKTFWASAIATMTAAMAIALDIPAAVAVNLTINNAGFEDPILADNEFSLNEIPGWQVYDPSDLIPDFGTTDPNVSGYGTFNPPTFIYPKEAPEGNHVSYLYLIEPPGSGIVGIGQTLTSAIAANTTYQLQVDIGNAQAYEDFPELAGFPGYAVQLLAGGTVIAEDFNTRAIAEGSFATSTLSYTAFTDDLNLGQSLEIRLLNLLQSEGLEVDFDNVRLAATATVPEPSLILSLGLFGLGGIMTRLRKKL